MLDYKPPAARVAAEIEAYAAGRDTPVDLARLLPAEVAGRAMVVRSLEMLPVECVVRGYLTGSGWAEYRAQGTVCGIPLPDGLNDGDRLPEPLFTPAYKAPMGEHDENISFEQTVELVGADRAAELRDLILAREGCFVRTRANARLSRALPDLCAIA